MITNKITTKKTGRPRRGAYMTVNYSISTRLISRVNEMADAAKISRSEAVETLLRIAIMEAGANWPDNFIKD